MHFQKIRALQISNWSDILHLSNIGGGGNMKSQLCNMLAIYRLHERVWKAHNIFSRSKRRLVSSNLTRGIDMIDK
jgi:hypothetical protein